MKNKIKLSASGPCAEKWDNFSPAPNGRFCASCKKNVTDFTKMSEEEIFLYFNENSAPVCGRFRPAQLKTYSQKDPFPNKTGLNRIQAGLLSLLMIFGSKQSFAQNESEITSTGVVQLQNHYDTKDVPVNEFHTIKGVVTDEYNEPIPGVRVYLKGTSIGTHTDINGKFSFPEELAVGDILVFSFIGYETREYVVPKNAREIQEIHMLSLSFELMGEVMVDEVYTGKASGSKNWWQKLKGLF